jgi:H+/Cl- antiporter ClcA
VQEANQVQAKNDAGARTKWWLTIPGWLAMGLGALLYAEVVVASVEAAHNVLDQQHPAWVFAAILVGWPLLVLGGWARMWRRSSQRRQVSARSPGQITRYGFGVLLLALLVMVLFVVSTSTGM